MNHNQSTYRKIIIPIGIFLLVYSGLIELLLFFEPEGSELDTFLEGVWYATVTVAAVGYGDYVPMSPYGKAVGFVFVIGSIVLAGYFVSQLTNYIARLNENRKMGFGGTKFEKHTFIIGWDHYSRSVADQLIHVNKKVAIVTTQRDDIELIYEHFHHSKNVFVLYSEYDNYDLLRKANIEKSSIVFINCPDDTQKLVLLLNLKKEFQNLKFIVTLENSDLKDTFKSAGVTYPLSKHDLSSKLLASYIFEPDAASFGEELLSYAHSDDDYDIKQYLVIKDNPYANQWYDDVFFELKKKHNAILIGISKKQQDGTFSLVKNPEEPIRIEVDDYVLLICNGKSEGDLTDVFGVEEGVEIV